MFDFVHNNRQVVTVALGLVGLGLLVGGGRSMFGSDQGNGSYLARVDGTPITERDVAELTRGQEIPPAMKPQVIGELVQQRIMLNEAADRNLVASIEQVREKIKEIKDFQKDGQFDPELYKTLLAANHLTPEQFENRIRDRLRLALLSEAIQTGGIGSKQAKDRIVDLLNATRDVEAVDFTAAQYLGKVSVSDADIKQYYDAHKPDYTLPERVKLDYLVLSRDELAAALPISDADIKNYYDAHRSDVAPEERKVRHILVKVDEKASAADRAAAHKKAEGLLDELKKNPERFADLAKQNSDDPGSAMQGGDLGYFQNNGQMVKPFSDAAFKLAKGQISDLVETQFGYHILQVEDVRNKSLDDVKAQIIGKLQHDAEASRFQASADKFGDTVYQQADSLQPTADAFKLTIQHSDWVMRDKATEPLLNDTKVRDAAFSSDVLDKHHNSEAIDMGNGKLIAVRVAEHQASTLQPLAQVTAAITDKLKQERAAKMAKDEGQKAVAALQKGEALSLTWKPSQTVNQFQHADLSPDAIKAVFAVPSDKMPGYAGVDAPEGYVVYKVAAGKSTPMEAMQRGSVEQTIDRIAAQAQAEVYATDMKRHHKVESH